ncbi:MAG TPA: glutathione S-transferase N-terminal domain-containing protein [Gammaproteobacteria bacterium]|nr:glutathione S-transferase N-terminal domain-containing protein [Gammaproteobacteria bacterium]
MKLRYSPTSPYVRKVLVLAIETGLDERIERVLTNPWADDAALANDNPLGKVPTLVTDDGMVLYDSPVICEYLDSLHHGTRVFPIAGKARWMALRQQALGDGILDAAVLRRLEGQRPAAQRSDSWETMQRETVQRGLDALEREAASWDGRLQIGQIAAACALGYLDFRFPQESWRTGRSALAVWFERFAARASMTTTLPTGQ